MTRDSGFSEIDPLSLIGSSEGALRAEPTNAGGRFSAKRRSPGESEPAIENF